MNPAGGFRFPQLALLMFFFPAFVLFSQEDTDGFGFGIEAAESPVDAAIKINGEISARLLVFTNDFDSVEKVQAMQLGDIFAGRLNFSAAGKTAEGIIILKIKPDVNDVSPVAIDEAYIRLFLGPVDLEAGLRKLTWGRADSFGPLDVINPLDFSDLSDMGDPRSIKLARPMLHASWNIGSFSKLEGVFIPWFQGNGYALNGRWAPEQVAGLASSLTEKLNTAFPLPGMDTALSAWLAGFELEDYYDSTSETLQYAQGGLRFTATLGSSDFGIQYYFGRMPRPAYTVDLNDFVGLFSVPPLTIDPAKINMDIDYNYYHQIGIDYAQVIAGFNLRAEVGANITSDLKGDDGAVYNPHLVWSLGFDRDLIWGINLNLQGNGLVRLMYDKIGFDPLVIDTEAGKDRSSTRISGILSKKFFRDELELKATALWGIEDRDFFIIPAIIWSKDDVTLELSAGFFGGDKTGELGQYRDNSYVKTVLSLSL
jgi:hypothetical protein